MRKGLSYLVSLPFVKFWAEIVKDRQFLDFLDMFLQNMRKYNDVYKLQPDKELDQSNQASAADVDGDSTQQSSG